MILSVTIFCVWFAHVLKVVWNNYYVSMFVFHQELAKFCTLFVQTGSHLQRFYLRPKILKTKILAFDAFRPFVSILPRVCEKYHNSSHQCWCLMYKNVRVRAVKHNIIIIKLHKERFTSSCRSRGWALWMLLRICRQRVEQFSRLNPPLNWQKIEELCLIVHTGGPVHSPYFYCPKCAAVKTAASAR